MREWLGGFGACGVFASIFSFFVRLFVLRFISLPCLLSCFALVVFACPLSCFVFVVAFSLSDYTQKERAQSVFASSLRVLCVVGWLLESVTGGQLI